MPRPLLLALLLVLTLLPGVASAQPLRRRPPLAPAEQERAQRVLDLLGPEHVLREAWRATRRHVFDRRLAEWDSLLERYLPQVAPARTPEEVYAVVNRMLGELEVSHLALMAGGVWERELAQEFTGRATARAGFELVALEGRLFVDGLAEGGPGDRAGLLEGDEVVTIEGAPAAESPRLQGAGHDPGLPGPPGYSLWVRDGERIALSVRRRAGEAPRHVELAPFPMTLVQASRNSARVLAVEVGGRTTTVGVLHLWHVINGDIARVAREALRGPLRQAEALVLDVRGRGGSAGVVAAILDMFDGRRPLWSKPVVCLTDGGTRSAKEILAWHWKRRNLGPVVGETTQGACLGCGFFELSDGSVLALPLQDVRRLTRGTVLEGVGVEPTHPVADAPLPYRAGADPILQAGLRAAASRVRRAVAVPF